jgi:hypothetical protein
LRTPADFAKALALGADAIAVSNAALQAIGCLGMRACHTNNCPVGIATQKPHLVARQIVDKSAERLANFLTASSELMTTLARACGHSHLNQFSPDDLSPGNRTWSRSPASPMAASCGDSHSVRKISLADLYCWLARWASHFFTCCHVAAMPI